MKDILKPQPNLRIETDEDKHRGWNVCLCYAPPRQRKQQTHTGCSQPDVSRR